MTTPTPPSGELPEEPRYLRLRNGFTVAPDGSEEATYGQYVTRAAIDARRALSAENGGK